MKRALILLLVAIQARADVLTLDQYLNRVKEKHQGFRGAELMSQASQERSNEGDLALAPTAFANLQYLSDAKPTANPAFQGTKTRGNSYSLGVSKLTKFGLMGKLSYNVNYVSLEGVNTQFVPLPEFYEARPMLELTQSLWKNGFGSETKATLTARQAQLLASASAERYKARLILLEAESLYWRLALAQEAVRVQQETLDRAKQILLWVNRRVRDDLADRADGFQAEAALELRQLQLQMAQDEERSILRSFQSFLGETDETVKLTLTPLSASLTQKIPMERPAGTRDDVQAAEQQQRAAIASAQLVRDQNSPTLDLVGSVAFNGREATASQTMSNSFKSTNPTIAAGVKFSSPLDFGLISDNRGAAAKEEQAAALVYQRKVFEQDRDWAELQRSFEDGQRRLALALNIEKIQEKKVVHERKRHQRGRTTTFQVLQFEQEYAASQLDRAKAQVNILTLLAKRKTFGGDL